MNWQLFVGLTELELLTAAAIYIVVTLAKLTARGSYR